MTVAYRYPRAVLEPIVLLNVDYLQQLSTDGVLQQEFCKTAPNISDEVQNNCENEIEKN